MNTTDQTENQIRGLRDWDIYIVKDVESMRHAQETARRLGIPSLRVWVSPDPYKLKGLTKETNIVIDHDYKASEQLKQVVHLHNSGRRS